MIKIKKLLLVGLLLYGGIVLGQSLLNISGGAATGSDGSVAYSVGQVFNTSNTGSNGNNSIGLSFTILTRASNWSERLVEDKPYIIR